MNFASFDFWEVFLIGFCVVGLVQICIRLITGEWNTLVGKLSILPLSLSLLAAESWETLLVFLWVVVTGYMGLVALGSIPPGKRRKLGIGLVVAVQIAPLFYYKYSNFVISDVLGLEWSRHGMLIPMGLSFYTFQMIGMTVDSLVAKKKIPRALDFLNFASFFPQIVAGPIERREDLLPQVKEIKCKLHRARLETAASWIVLGFFYKLAIADNLGIAAERTSVDAGNAFHVWTECLMFGFRIYFDFAGYSFIAFGLAAAFGIDLTLNFRSPYLVRNIQEFWRHWHVTLSQWFRDYVYIPLGGSRARFVTLNILIVFLVSGIWHGAGWNFVLWGLLHGIGVAVLAKVKIKRMPQIFAWAFTMVYVFFTWLFFYETRMQVLKEKALALLSPSGYSLAHIREFTSFYNSRGEFLNTGFLLILAVMCMGMEWLSRNSESPYRHLRIFKVSIVLVILTVLLAPSQRSGFIYFNF